jgi:hypothetical protein
MMRVVHDENRSFFRREELDLCAGILHRSKQRERSSKIPEAGSHLRVRD